MLEEIKRYNFSMKRKNSKETEEEKIKNGRASDEEFIEMKEEREKHVKDGEENADEYPDDENG